MNSIKSEGLEPKKEKKKSTKIFKTSLALTIIVFVFTMSYPSSYFQIVKPAEAATLTSIAVLPTNNIVNTRTTYDIIFKTATTGDIKTIVMHFASNFDISAATRVIERSGIGSGSITFIGSPFNNLVYTVSSPVSVPAGTTIRLEIGRIINSDTAGGFKIGIKTVSTSDTTIDGETLSPSFPIKDVTGNDVSPNFMVQKTLFDDTVGHTRGWNPNGVTKLFFVSDPDITGPAETLHVDINLSHPDNYAVSCMVQFIEAGSNPGAFFHVGCPIAPADGSVLRYLVTKLPSHIVASSLSVSSSESTPSSESSSHYEYLRAHDQIASEFP